MYVGLYSTQTLLGNLFGLDTTDVSCEVEGRMLEVLSEVLPAPAREEPLDLALAASSSDRSSGRSGGGKRKRRIGTLAELCPRRPRSSRKPSSMAPNRSCPSPKTRAAAKTSTPANARGAPPRCRW